jgi:hypothetical protein
VVQNFTKLTSERRPEYLPSFPETHFTYPEPSAPWGMGNDQSTMAAGEAEPGPSSSMKVTDWDMVNDGNDAGADCDEGEATDWDMLNDNIEPSHASPIMVDAELEIGVGNIDPELLDYDKADGMAQVGDDHNEPELLANDVGDDETPEVNDNLDNDCKLTPYKMANAETGKAVGKTEPEPAPATRTGKGKAKADTINTNTEASAATGKAKGKAKGRGKAKAKAKDFDIDDGPSTAVTKNKKDDTTDTEAGPSTANGKAKGKAAGRTKEKAKGKAKRDPSTKASEAEGMAKESAGDHEGGNPTAAKPGQGETKEIIYDSADVKKIVKVDPAIFAPYPRVKQHYDRLISTVDDLVRPFEIMEAKKGLFDDMRQELQDENPDIRIRGLVGGRARKQRGVKGNYVSYE